MSKGRLRTQFRVFRRPFMLVGRFQAETKAAYPKDRLLS
nr:MAG TPA: hypothetical protein [Inoviridae sp.]